MSDAPRDGERHSRRNVLLLYLICTLTTTSHGSTELIFPLNLDWLGHPLPLIGLTLALMALGSLVARIPSGFLYRTALAKVLGSGSLAVMGITSIGLGFSSLWAGQAGLGAVHGFSFGLANTVQLALLFEVRPRDRSAAPVMAWY